MGEHYEPWRTEPGREPLRIRTAPEPMPLVIYDSNGDPMVTVRPDHTVVLHQPERTNEAARLFWRAIQDYGQSRCVVTHEDPDG